MIPKEEPAPSTAGNNRPPSMEEMPFEAGAAIPTVVSRSNTPLASSTTAAIRDLHRSSATPRSSTPLAAVPQEASALLTSFPLEFAAGVTASIPNRAGSSIRDASVLEPRSTRHFFPSTAVTSIGAFATPHDDRAFLDNDRFLGQTGAANMAPPFEVGYTQPGLGRMRNGDEHRMAGNSAFLNHRQQGMDAFQPNPPPQQRPAYDLYADSSSAMLNGFEHHRAGIFAFRNHGPQGMHIFQPSPLPQQFHQRIGAQEARADSLESSLEVLAAGVGTLVQRSTQDRYPLQAEIDARYGGGRLVDQGRPALRGRRYLDDREYDRFGSPPEGQGWMPSGDEHRMAGSFAFPNRRQQDMNVLQHGPAAQQQPDYDWSSDNGGRLPTFDEAFPYVRRRSNGIPPSSNTSVVQNEFEDYNRHSSRERTSGYDFRYPAQPIGPRTPPNGMGGLRDRALWGFRPGGGLPDRVTVGDRPGGQFQQQTSNRIPDANGSYRLDRYGEPLQPMIQQPLLGADQRLVNQPAQMAQPRGPRANNTRSSTAAPASDPQPHTEAAPGRRPLDILPVEIWERIFKYALLYPRPLQPILSPSPNGSTSLRIAMVPAPGDGTAQQPISTAVLYVLIRTNRVLRNLALDVFFAWNEWCLASGSPYSVPLAWVWLKDMPADVMEYLNNVHIDIDFTPGGGSRRIRRLLPTLRRLGRSRFLSRLTIRINTSYLTADQRANFTTVPAFRVLSQFRGITNLNMTFNPPWPEALNWLTERMTIERPEAADGLKHLLPAIAQAPRAISTIRRLPDSRFHPFLLAMNIDPSLDGRTRRELAPLIRNFMESDAGDAELDVNNFTSDRPAQDTLAAGGRHVSHNTVPDASTGATALLESRSTTVGDITQADDMTGELDDMAQVDNVQRAEKRKIEFDGEGEPGSKRIRDE